MTRSTEIIDAITLVTWLQAIVLALIAIIAWFIKRELNNITGNFEKTFRKMDKYETALYDLSGSVQRVIGQMAFWNGIERRG